jgi:uncharacterized protein (DUF1697 family)
MGGFKMKKILILCLIVMVLFAAGCAVEKEEVKEAKEETKVVVVPKACPDSCDDSNICTTDYCSENTGYECKHRVKTPCCGDSKCEEGEDFLSCSDDCEREIDLNDQLVEVLDKNKEIDNYEYMYSTGNIYIETWIRENTIKQRLTKTSRSHFDTVNDIILLDTDTKTAHAYCSRDICDEEKVARSTDYYKYRIETPLEFAEKIKLDAETVHEERIDNRDVLVVKYTDDDGAEVKVWVIMYYGVPTRVETTKDGSTVRLDYSGMAFNSVSDKDLTEIGLKYAEE